MLASRERWAAACSDGSASVACLRVQDHRLDYLPPAAPWTPIGHAAAYASAGLVFLALAAVLLPWLIVGGRAGRRAGVSIAAAGCSIGMLVLARPEPFDATPWADATSAVLVLLAGAALWPATGRRRPARPPAPADLAAAVVATG